ncbi:hypothetical protein BDW02DRAFT_394007 [Decorospora gaudefroyi]|uniref:Uncharacterized protein n=1 Tax=Decorospora gaudefroyi TaxID=184978 RepID=A0A6A5K7D4_9PLEO|nr:hypothetical protein BDW02DRAFT_394007 [Decorospora gaudefroyi]
MTANKESKTAKTGWTDRELLSSLLFLVQKENVTFNWNDGVYPAGRNANGFKQKINVLKNVLRPEWDAMGGGDGAPATAEGTPTKKPTTPRKRKVKGDAEGDAAEPTPKKARGRPKKNVATPEPEVKVEEVKKKAATPAPEEKVEVKKEEVPELPDYEDLPEYEDF